MENFIIVLILVVIVAATSWYIYKSKKSGRKCVGCPDGCCSGKKEDGATCGCCCGGSGEQK